MDDRELEDLTPREAARAFPDIEEPPESYTLEQRAEFRREHYRLAQSQPT